MKNTKKHVLRAPPRSVELISTLDTIKIHRKLGEQKHYFYVRITLIITDIITLGLGIYILINFNFFFNEKYNFNYRKLLLTFIYIYSPSAIGIFFVSLILSLFVYTFYCCCEKEKIHGAPLYDEKDISMTAGSLKDYEDTMNRNSEKNINKDNENDNKNKENENGYSSKDNEKDKIDKGDNEDNEDKKNESSKEPEIKEEYIGINADKVSLFPYTLTIFVIMTIIFYFIAFPLSIILLVILLKDKVYEDYVRYWALYVFILANLINGVLIVVVFFHMFIVKRKENNILKKNMEINEDKIMDFRKEVQIALKKAK